VSAQEARLDPANVDIYSVGLLHDLTHFVHGIDRRSACRAFRNRLRYPIGEARRGNWRAVKNYFNGYLAEADDMTGVPRCGTGWTRGRAYRSLLKAARRASQ
jgi:hypothetical protein